MNQYTADITYLTDDNVLIRKKNKRLNAVSILEAVILLKAQYFIIRIRAVEEINMEVTKEHQFNYSYINLRQ